MPNGWLPSLNPHSLLQPPHTQGMSVMPEGWLTFTSMVLIPPMRTCGVMSMVAVVRPMS